MPPALALPQELQQALQGLRQAQRQALWQAQRRARQQVQASLQLAVRLALPELVLELGRSPSELLLVGERSSGRQTLMALTWLPTERCAWKRCLRFGRYCPFAQLPPRPGGATA